MIKQLIEALYSQKIECTAEEVADAIWLALHMGTTAAPRAGLRQQTESTASSEPVLEENKFPTTSISSTRQRPNAQGKASETAARGNLYASASQLPGGDESGLPFRAPAVPSIPGALDLSRALRPLMRRIPSPFESVFDEEASVQQFAEEGIWIPFLRPAQMRWLDVALVVDEGASMRVWSPVVSELRTLLERLGAFRDVRVWRMKTDSLKGEVALYAGNQQIARKRRELIDPAGRRLILIVTDCVSPAWYGQKLPALLAEWGESNPVSIIQMLPQRLWSRTALGEARLLRVRASRPGLPNSRLRREDIRKWTRRKSGKQVPIPILTLDATPASMWAHVVAADGDAYAPAYILSTEVRELKYDKTRADAAGLMPVDERLKGFRANASATAVQLAHLLAAAPLALPIMRLVQRVMLPHSRQVHLAEVFLSGLLQRVKTVEGADDPDAIQYDFLPGVRGLLLDSSNSDITDSVEVLKTVSRYLESRLDQSFDFGVILENPAAAGKANVGEHNRAFANVCAEVLLRLGGPYAEVAEALKERTDATPVDLPSSIQEDDTTQVATVLDPKTSKPVSQTFTPGPPIEKTPEPTKLINIPYERNSFFTGREKVLEDLHRVLSENRRATLSGVGGIGKTHTALEYAYRYQGEYQTVLWARADSPDSLKTDFVAIAARLDLPEKSAVDKEMTVAALKYWLGTHADWILILDNDDELKQADDFLHANLQGHVLVTTQRSDVNDSNGVRLDAMEPEEGALFLLRRSKKIAEHAELSVANESDRQTAQAISEVMGGFPLALAQAGAYLEEMHMGLEEYLTMYRSDRSLLPDAQTPIESYGLSVITVFLMALTIVNLREPAIGQLIYTTAFLAPDEIPEELFILGADEIGEPLTLALKKPEGLTGLLEEAERFALIKRNPDEKTFDVHMVFQQLLKQVVESEKEKLRAERTVRALNRAFPASDYEYWPLCDRLLLHVMAVAGTIASYELTTEDGGVLLGRAGYYCYQRAQYREADILYKQSLEICVRAFGPRHPQVAVVLNYMGLLYRIMGKYPEAQSMFRRALEIREEALGPDDPKVANSLNNLALVYHDQRQFDEAEELYLRSLELNTRLLGPYAPEVAYSLNNLGLIYREKGRYEEALPLLERSLEISRKAFGTNHPDVATTLNNLATFHRLLGNYREAMKLYDQSFAIRESALGPEHPDVAQSFYNLALLEEDQNRFLQAEGMYKQSLKIYEKALGPDSPRVVLVLNDYAGLLRKLNRNDEALAMERRARAIGY
jgi:tetratricopeptide (TPR) repeat protein